MKWKNKLISELTEKLEHDPYWEVCLNKAIASKMTSVHLAVFNEPYLSLVLAGKKKIESRFSKNKISPYGKVRKGDIIILKESGGLIKGVFVAGKVSSYSLSSKSVLQKIKVNYAAQICSDIDKDFWKNRQYTNYATLIGVKKVKKVGSFSCGKRDRGAWSVIRPGVER